MTNVKALKEMLSSYQFQHGSRADYEVIKKANKMIKHYEDMSKKVVDNR